MSRILRVSNNGSQGPWGSRSEEDIMPRRDALPLFSGDWGGFNFGKNRRRNIILAILAALLLWLLSGIYYVDTDEQGLVLRFGKFHRSTAPGLHVHFPFPIESVYRPVVTKVNRIEIGYRGEEGVTSTDISRSRQVLEESLMLTGDENIVDINFAVFWRINDARKYLFNILNPEGTIKSAAESAMREVIGRNNIEYLLTEGRDEVENEVQILVQKLCNDYGVGVEITQIQLKKVDPPQQVIESFRDVQRAKTDQERFRNQAEAYRNDIIPKARGNAEKILQSAEAYKREIVERSLGDAGRFLSVLKAYETGKEVTVERIYLETLQEVLSNSNKVIIGSSKGDQPGVFPFLPLPEIEKRLRGEDDGGDGVDR